MLSFFVDTTVCGFSLYQVFAYFLIYSCLGWCLEVIYAAVTTGKLINRGFLNGPVCPIYGFGMIIVLFVLTPLSHSLLLLYLGGVLLPSALELVGGWALYKLYHTRWWDYSDYPFNIGGYICLEFSLLWGVGTLIVMKLVHPIIANAVALIPPLVGLILMFLLYAIYAADTIATAFAASDLARDLDALEKVADSMHAVSDAMTELLGTNAMAMDQKMDERRLQFKLAAAEARDNAAKLNAREAAAAMRAKADEAMEAAKRQRSCQCRQAGGQRHSRAHGRTVPAGTAGRGAAGPQRGASLPHPAHHPALRQAPYAPRLPQAEARCAEPLAGHAAGTAEAKMNQKRERSPQKGALHFFMVRFSSRGLPGTGRPASSARWRPRRWACPRDRSRRTTCRGCAGSSRSPCPRR